MKAVNTLVLFLGVYSLSVGTLHADHVTEATQVAKTVLISFKSASHARSEQRIKTQEDKSKAIATTFARSTFYNKDEASADWNSKRKVTSTQVNITTLENLKLRAVAVDPSVIPYGSVIVSPSGEVFVAIDTGGDVKSRKAATEYAALKGLPKASKEYNAPVLDFYSYGQIGQKWDSFKTVRYEGKTSFKNLSQREKLEYLRTLSRVLTENAIVSRPAA